MKKLIGNTPMIKIKYKYKGQEKEIFAKLEYYNLTGSIKDRMANYIITEAIKDKKLKENMPIIEATSGNTGISLSALGAYYKRKVYIFMPDWVSEERLKLMKMYGADVKLFSKEEGGFKKCINEAKKKAKETNGYLVNQFENQNNLIAHYQTTGNEILNQISNIGGFVSGIGTGGTLMGTSKCLKEKYPNLITCAIEPDTMAIISKGIIDSHKIEGIGDDFIPELVDVNKIDKVLLINDLDAINMSKKLSLDLGLGVGISSGANLLGSILLKEEIKENVITVFPDDSKKYLSTELSQNLDLNPCMISNQIQLIDYEII